MKNLNLNFTVFLILLSITSVFNNNICSQNILKDKFEKVADTSNSKIGVNVLNLETGESISLNGDHKFPMQSVYKFPIALVMLHRIDKGEFALKDSVEILKKEYIPIAGHSPIRDKYPNGAKLTIEKILEYNVSESDGTACDVLLRLLGGTKEVEQCIHRMGIRDIAISTTEMIQVANDTIQYQNWSTPEAMSKLLKKFYKGEFLLEENQKLLIEYMSISNKWFDKRLKGFLPEETHLIHKTGTARTYNGLTRATNDAGIIILPNKIPIAISVFVSDSYDSQTKRENIIAAISKATYDYWNK